MMIRTGTATPAAMAATLVLFLGTGVGVPVELGPIEVVGEVELPTAEELSGYRQSELGGMTAGSLTIDHLPRARHCRLVIRGHRGHAK